MQWLLTAAPAGRPTARQVLSSELLPPTVEDQALSDMLRCAQQPIPAAHSSTLSIRAHLHACQCVDYTNRRRRFHRSGGQSRGNDTLN